MKGRKAGKVGKPLRKILLIAKRDYVAAVMRKAFLIGLVVAPLLFGGSFLGIALLRVGAGERRVALVDRTGTAASAVIDAARNKSAEDLAGKSAPQMIVSRYIFETVQPDRDAAAQRIALSERVRRRELFAFIEIERGKVAYYTDSQSGPARQWLASAVDNGLRRARLAELGVDPSHFDEVLRSVPMENRSLASRNRVPDAPRRNPIEATAVPFTLLFLMMTITMMGAAPMLQGVAEDKMQRVFEMLLASATSFELIAGKVLASVGVSLTGSVFYVTAGLFVLQGMAMIGLAPFALLPWFFLFLICEVTILSALGAALGSACSTPRDAQQLVMVILSPVMLPIFLIFPLTEQPNGPLATAMSFFPPFTPLIMMLRQAMPGGVPAWQPWVGLAGVAVWTLLTTWAAARVFRIGILLQGQTPKVAELLRWVVRG
jgi:ABC-2 type transport system permease protein